MQQTLLKNCWNGVPECNQEHVKIHEKTSENRHGFVMRQNLKKHCKTTVKTWFLGYRWQRNSWKFHAKSMQIWSSKSVCKKHIKPWKISSKWQPKGIPKASRASKTNPTASRRRPRVSKKRPGGAKLDLLVFYSIFWRPWSTGGMRRGALITYRLGRLT